MFWKEHFPKLDSVKQNTQPPEFQHQPERALAACSRLELGLIRQGLEVSC